MAEMILVAVLGILLGIAVGARARSKPEEHPPMPGKIPPPPIPSRPPIEPLGGWDSEKRKRT